MTRRWYWNSITFSTAALTLALSQFVFANELSDMSTIDESIKAADFEPIEFNRLNAEDIPSVEVNASMLQPTAMLSVSPADTAEEQNSEEKYFKIYTREDHEIQPEETQEAYITNDDIHEEEPSKFSKVVTFLKGEPAENMVAFGMWSKHFATDQDYRETNNLLGLQYKGMYASTFSNSHSKQTFVVGIARTVYERPILFNKVRYTLGYKIGPMYGYTNKGVPNIAGFSVLPMIVNGFNLSRVGMDFNIVPGNAVSFNLHAVKPKEVQKIQHTQPSQKAKSHKTPSWAHKI